MRVIIVIGICFGITMIQYFALILVMQESEYTKKQLRRYVIPVLGFFFVAFDAFRDLWEWYKNLEEE